MSSSTQSKTSPSTIAADDTSFHAGQVATIASGHAIHDTYTAFLSPLLPLFIEKLSLLKSEAGLLTVFMQMPSLAQPVIGYLADRASVRYLVILTPAITATLMSLLGIVPSYGWLALLLVLVGFSSATLHATGPVLAGKLSGNRLGQGMSFWMVGGEVGRTLGPLVIVGGVRILSLQGTPWLMLGGWLASFFIYLGLRHAPDRVAGAVTEIHWRAALRGMERVMIPLGIILVFRGMLSIGLATFLPTFLTEEGTGWQFAGASLSIYEAAGVVGALVGGSLSDHFGRRTVMLVSTALSPLFMLGFIFLKGWLRVPLLLGLGFSVLSFTPVLMALVQESFPDRRALANGVYMALSFIINSGAVVLFGWFADLWGTRQSFVISSLSVIPVLAVIFWLPMDRKLAGVQEPDSRGH